MVFTTDSDINRQRNSGVHSDDKENKNQSIWTTTTKEILLNTVSLTNNPRILVRSQINRRLEPTPRMPAKILAALNIGGDGCSNKRERNSDFFYPNSVMSTAHKIEISEVSQIASTSVLSDKKITSLSEKVISEIKQDLLSDIPMELFLNITKFLSFREKSPLRRVCSSWKNFLDSETWIEQCKNNNIVIPYGMSEHAKTLFQREYKLYLNLVKGAIGKNQTDNLTLTQFPGISQALCKGDQIFLLGRSSLITYDLTRKHTSTRTLVKPITNTILSRCLHYVDGCILIAHPAKLHENPLMEIYSAENTGEDRTCALKYLSHHNDAETNTSEILASNNEQLLILNRNFEILKEIPYPDNQEPSLAKINSKVLFLNNQSLISRLGEEKIELNPLNKNYISKNHALSFHTLEGMLEIRSLTDLNYAVQLEIPFFSKGKFQIDYIEFLQDSVGFIAIHENEKYFLHLNLNTHNWITHCFDRRYTGSVVSFQLHPFFAIFGFKNMFSVFDLQMKTLINHRSFESKIVSLENTVFSEGYITQMGKCDFDQAKLFTIFSHYSCHSS